MATSLRLVVILSLFAFVYSQRCRVVPERLLGCSRWSRADFYRCVECGLGPVACQGRRNFYRCQPRRVVTTVPATTTASSTARSTSSGAFQTAPTSTTATTAITTEAAPTPMVTTASTETQTTTTSTTTTTTGSQTQLGEHSCPDRSPVPSPCPFAQGNFFSNSAYCATSVVSESGCRVETDGNTVGVTGRRCLCSWGVRCRCGTGLVSDYVTVVSTKADCRGPNGNERAFRDCILQDSSFCKTGSGGASVDNNLLDSVVDTCCTVARGEVTSLGGGKQCLL